MTDEQDESQHGSGLTYEETPIIDPASGSVVEQPVNTSDPRADTPFSPQGEKAPDVVPEAAQIFGDASAGQPQPTEHPYREESFQAAQPRRRVHVGSVLFVLLLFGLGVWLSMQLRSFFAPITSAPIAVPTVTPKPAPVISSDSASPVASTSARANTAWQTYPVMSVVTGAAISGASYKLPADVAEPTCDGSGCPSRGTNLPGGSRFTVAARGKGQALPDFRGAILTDATGKEFTMTQTTVGGVYGYEYTGNFTGRTGGGYTFTQMHGILVPVHDGLSVEFNHFAPAGVSVDFASDEQIFAKIVASFAASGVSGEKGMESATPSAN